MCKARPFVFEYVRRRRLNCREPKAEVKIYRYNKTLAATDNHRPFPSHDIGDALESTMDHATEIDISKVFKSASKKLNIGPTDVWAVEREDMVGLNEVNGGEAAQACCHSPLSASDMNIQPQTHK